jgi:phosphatidate cytidylyltransferase
MEQSFIKMRVFLVRTITGVILTLVIGTIFLFLPTRFFSILLLLILVQILLLEWPALVKGRSWLWLIAPIYLILPIFLIILLNEQGYFKLVALMLTVVPAFDIGAYILGNLIGTHKLCPKVSPNKTWEGVLGGYLSVLVTMFLARFFVGGNFVLLPTLFFALLISTFATCGDLFESWLKRRADVKDSGRILPGHGGLLDRIDGFLFVSFLFYFFSTWIVTNFLN